MTGLEIVSIAADPASFDGAETATALARHLDRHGLALREWRIVGAEEGLVERALRQAIEGGGLVAVLGDGEGAAVARRALARVLGSRLVLSPRALEALEAVHASRDLAMPRRAEAQALVPSGATVLVPAGGGEPGLLAAAAGALVVLLPGEAAAAIALVDEHVVARLPVRAAAGVTVTRILRLVGLDAREVERRLGEGLRGAGTVTGHAVGTADEVRVRLRADGPTAGAAEAGLRAAEPGLRQAFGVAWYGDGDEPLEVVVGRLLRARGWTLALAESCTGGLVGHRLTQVTGSSAYFERGFVVYSNAAKQALLGVPETVLAQHGAVSRECAEAMARGARRAAATHLGVSVTGIAGPDGGTPTKPVGTVFIGLADEQGAVVEHHRFERDRAGNKARSASAALDLVRRHCLGAG